MARYERLGGDDEEGGSDGGGGGPGLKRNLLVVVLALALFATILGNLFRCVSVFSKSVFLKVYTYKVYPAYASSKLCKFFLNCTCETNVCIVIYQLSQELFTSPHTITGPHVLICTNLQAWHLGCLPLPRGRQARRGRRCFPQWRRARPLRSPLSANSLGQLSPVTVSRVYLQQTDLHSISLFHIDKSDQCSRPSMRNSREGTSGRRRLRR